MTADFEPTDRTTVKRLPERGRYDRETVHAVLDEALICHVAFAIDGQPFVIPTIHARDGDTLYFHGSPASRMLRRLGEGIPVCVNVTLVDGLVMARSVFHHSMNYRSVVIVGEATRLEDDDEKLNALEVIVERVAPGRSADARGPNPKELSGTLVLALPIDEASAKVRTGPPGDDEEDLDLDVWAGVVPVSLAFGRPEGDAYVKPGVAVPDYLADYRRG
jgi:nitroimidazol reductase NimA-like FMN-containing flavoprotein (pyridoxamine 5'-phosphate oxidase superfamily)